MSAYPIEITPDEDGTFLATCPLLPEVTTFGETQADALIHARNALEEALAARIARGADAPKPQSLSQAARPYVTLPGLIDLKIALYNAMRGSGVSVSELSRRMEVHRPQVDRLFDLNHHSRLDQLEGAFEALGYRMDFGDVVRAA